MKAEYKRFDEEVVDFKIEYLITRIDGDAVHFKTKSSKRTMKQEKPQRAGDARLRDFAEASSDWFWEMDEHCRFTYFSERFTEITGVPQDALLGKTRQETRIPDVDPAEWQKHLSDLAAHRSFRDFHHPRTLPDGRVVHLSINGMAIFDAAGKFLGYRGTGSDISARTMAENALRESEQRLRGVFDYGFVGIAVLSPAGHFLEVNQAYCDFLGYKAEELIGQHFDQIIHADDLAVVCGQPVGCLLCHQLGFLDNATCDRPVLLVAAHLMPVSPTRFLSTFATR